MSGRTRRALRLGVLSDFHHTANSAEPLAFHHDFELSEVLERTATAIDWLGTEGIDALALLGDLAHHGDVESQLDLLRIASETWGGRIFVVPGNHDLREDAGGLVRALRQLNEPRVSQPSPRGEHFHGFRIAGLDPTDAPPEQATAEWGRDPVVLLSHWPTISLELRFVEAGLRYPDDHPMQATYAAALEERGALTVVINGHLHARASVQLPELLQLSVGAMVESPFEASIVEVVGEADDVSVRYRARSFAAHDVDSAPVLSAANGAFNLSPQTTNRRDG
jgi:predicted phosphodiesterase